MQKRLPECDAWQDITNKHLQCFYTDVLMDHIHIERRAIAIVVGCTTFNIYILMLCETI